MDEDRDSNDGLDEDHENQGVILPENVSPDNGISEDEDIDPNENVQDGFYPLEESAGSVSSDRLSRGEGSEGESEDETLNEFNPEIPARHNYLGEEMEELHGRVVLEEGAITEIPIVVMNFHLVPGQTLPMTVFHAVFQNAIRRCVVNDRIFGVVHTGVDSIDGRMIVSKNTMGTVAEIYEFQEENDHMPPPSPFDVLRMGSNFALKAKGTQRFNVIDVRRQGDGNLMARVKIRPEIKLSRFLVQIMNSLVRYQFPLFSSLPQPETIQPSQSNPQSLLSGFTSRLRRNRKDSDRETAESTVACLKSQIRFWRPISKYYSALTPWPPFVYDNYDERILVEKIHRKLIDELKGLMENHASIPVDGSQLSFWLAQNLTMDDTIRLRILKMDSALQRLRFELYLLENVSRVISCRRCSATVADHGDIFSMSTEGPQGTYVNPTGYVHETLTVHKVHDLISRGFASTEASWFQGYSWTIVECRNCREHLGWKFRAVERLKPKKFWGLARKSITFKYNFSTDSVNSSRRDLAINTIPRFSSLPMDT